MQKLRPSSFFVRLFVARGTGSRLLQHGDGGIEVEPEGTARKRERAAGRPVLLWNCPTQAKIRLEWATSQPAEGLSTAFEMTKWKLIFTTWGEAEAGSRGGFPLLFPWALGWGSGVPPGRESVGGLLPGVEMPGYFHSSLRTWVLWGAAAHRTCVRAAFCRRLVHTGLASGLAFSRRFATFGSLPNSPHNEPRVVGAARPALLVLSARAKALGHATLPRSGTAPLKPKSGLSGPPSYPQR